MATFQCPEATRVTLATGLSPMLLLRGPSRLWITGNPTPLSRGGASSQGPPSSISGRFSHLGSNFLQIGLPAPGFPIQEFCSRQCCFLLRSCATPDHHYGFHLRNLLCQLRVLVGPPGRILGCSAVAAAGPQGTVCLGPEPLGTTERIHAPSCQPWPDVPGGNDSARNSVRARVRGHTRYSGCHRHSNGKCHDVMPAP